MKWWGRILLFTILLSGCSNLNLMPTPVDDGYEHYLWVGDDQLQTGPLDMQTLLLLELAGDSQFRRMHRAISPRFTLVSALNQEEFLQSTNLQIMDLVIIQAFGVQRDFSEENFKKNAKTWVDFFKKQGIQVVVFYPWSSAVDSVSEKERLDRMIHQLGWQEGLTIVPVGPAWQAALKIRPEMKLYASDGIHPSALGVYLSACVLYTSITGESPLDNPVYTSIGFDSPEEIVKVDGDTIQFLQEIAWETVNDYLQKDEFRVIIKR
ncbi:MAG: hypothetical protein CVU41_15330 [Chloroflexi bacterium HGW-Chloroflexi-3]|nr:MAG: hypothetical protein CVU41_15330 [Chloroflexi bacterium HGW-Chloroflexi-3]